MHGGRYAERLLVRLLFTSVVLFFSLHIVMVYRDSVSAYSGPFSAGPGDWPPDSPVVTLFLQDYSLMPYVRVVVNGEVKGAFNHRYVTVAVQDGDSLALDGTFYKRPVRVEIFDVSGGVISPGKGRVITLNGNMAPLGRVKIKG